MMEFGVSEYPVGIVRAACAGLVADQQPSENNTRLVIFEASVKATEVAGTATDMKRFKDDLAAHFINNRLAKTLEVTD